jgi:hypothetical protein
VREPGLILDLDDVNIRRKLWEKVRTLRGLWEVDFRPIKPKRSLQQNRYYFGCFVLPWRDWLRENYGDPTITSEQAHEELKRAVIGSKRIVHKETGDVIELVPDTRDKDTTEFSVYLEQAGEFLARFAEIVVIEPERFLTGE